MGKQKYPATAGGVNVDGERKQRNHTKSGKLAQRRDRRRLEAIQRQVMNIQKLEQALEKATNKAEVQTALNNAQLTLQKIRGGVPHNVLISRFKAPETNETTPSIETTPQPSKKTGKRKAKSQ